MGTSTSSYPLEMTVAGHLLACLSPSAAAQASEIKASVPTFLVSAIRRR